MRNISSKELLKEWTIGWNVGNSLDACKTGGLESETSWQNPPVTQKLIDNVIETGINVIRIPVTWYNHFTDETGTIEPKWMDRVQEVVDYAYKRGVFVILDTHHENWFYTSDENYPHASAILKCVWEQICARFSDYGERLLFEGLNEPRKLGQPDEWESVDPEARAVVNKLNADFISTVRNSGEKNALRHLVLATYCGTCTEDVMRELEVPNDDKIIVNVHSYVPWEFACLENGAKDFDPEDTAQTANLDATFDYMKTYCTDKDIPLIIDEFGAVNRNNSGQRIAYIRYFRKKADELNIKYLWWDNGYIEADRGSFGLFNRKTGKCVFKNIVNALTE
ncbi:MAG: glycoside hydrolase family 5 protein [Oscillospiraceae bacterium]|nr:glycoside hydrolase family 5 protein [Oscillospiraceae bacterium]